MKRRRLGIFLAVVVALLSLTVVFVGCDWFDDDESSTSNNGATTAKYVVVANTERGRYADNTVWGNLSVFKINSNGTLKFQDNVSLSPPGSEPAGIALHPNKKFVYVTNQYGYDAETLSWTAFIHVFSFSADNGALTEIEGSPFAHPHGHDGYLSLAFTPDGKFLYTTNAWWGEVLVHAVDNTTGALTTVETYYSVKGAHSIAMHPTGNFLYVGTVWEYGNGSLYIFAIDPDTGLLTETAGSPFTPIIEVLPGNPGNWVGLQATPDGKYLFGAGQWYGGVWGIDNVSGDLTQIGLESTGDWNIKDLAIAPTLPFLYSANWNDNSVGAWKVDNTATVDNVAGMPFKAGPNPRGLSVTGDSKYLYVTNYDDYSSGGENGSVIAYTISKSSGKLGKIGTYKNVIGYAKKLLAIP